MAKPTAKSEKAAATSKAKSVAAEEINDDEPAPQINEQVEAGEISDEPEAAPAPSPVAAAPVETPEVAESLVRIVCQQEVDPAPVIGHPGHGGYDFREHGVQKLEAKKTYIVPRAVAEVLLDKKVAFLLN